MSETKPASAVEEVEALWGSLWTSPAGRGLENENKLYDKALSLARRLEKASVEWDRWMKIASKCQISKDLITGQYESAEAALKEAQGLLRDSLSWIGEESSKGMQEFRHRIQRHLDSRTGKEHG